MGQIGRAVVSRLSEVTNLPLLKIFAYIAFGRVEFVLPPTMYEWGMEGKTEVFRTSLDQCVLPPMFDAHRVEMGSEAVVSRLIEVTNLPLLREVEIGPMDCPCKE